METGIRDGGFEILHDPVSFLAEEFCLPDADILSFSPLVLAYIGDAVYEILIRTCVVMNGNAPVNKLHRATSSLVKAKSQAQLVHAIKKYLTEEEKKVLKRGRNAKSFTKAKNASTADYRQATGFEALIGYLYLQKKFKRLTELVRIGIQEAGPEIQLPSDKRSEVENG